MPYTTFGNGYDWRGADGRPDFVSIDNTPQGLPQVFQNGFAVGPQNPVDAHVQFAMQTHAGQSPQTAISPAIAAMQSALPALQQKFMPTAPAGFGGSSGFQFDGWNGPTTMRMNGADDAFANRAKLQKQRADMNAGYLDGSNAAGTVDEFFRHPSVMNLPLEAQKAAYELTFGQGRLQRDLIGTQLAKQRAAQNPNGYTPVTYRDVDEYIANQSPTAIKASSEQLAEFHRQSGISALDFLHSIDEKNIAHYPAVTKKDGTVTPAHEVYADPTLQANLRASLNRSVGANSWPAPLSGNESDDAADLHRRSMESGQWNNTPFASSNPSAAAPVSPISPLINPEFSPLRQSLINAGRALGPDRGNPVQGLTRNLANLPTWIRNKIFATQNDQHPYIQKGSPLPSMWGNEDTPLY